MKRRVEKRRTGLFSRVLTVEVGLVIAPCHACPLCSQLNCLPHSPTILQVAPARWRFCRRVEHRRSCGCRLTLLLGCRAVAGAAGVSSVVWADMALKSSCSPFVGVHPHLGLQLSFFLFFFFVGTDCVSVCVCAT